MGDTKQIENDTLASPHTIKDGPKQRNQSQTISPSNAKLRSSIDRNIINQQKNKEGSFIGTKVTYDA